MCPLLCRGLANLGMILNSLPTYLCNRTATNNSVTGEWYSILTVAPLLFVGDVLDDYPDSPGGEGGLTREAASHLLDSEEGMEISSNLPSGSGSGSAHGASGSIKRVYAES